jgi:hypothetical protein
MPTFASGTLYYLPVTLTNSQTTATPANYTAKIPINQSNYSSYLASDLSNVNWQDGNGNILKSWRQSGTSNTGTDALWWVNLGSLTVPANGGTLTIYLCFYATTQNVLNTTNTGVAPQLTATYAQYDNGVNVFPWYENFAGTSLPSDLSDILQGGTLTVNNGLSMSDPASGDGVYIYKTTGISSSSATVLDAYIFGGGAGGATESYIVLAFSLGPVNSPFAQNAVNNGYYADVRVGATSDFFDIWVTSSGSPTDLAYATGDPTQTQIVTLMWPATGIEKAFTTYNNTSLSATDTTFSLPSTTYPLFGVYGNGAAGAVSSYWMRARLYPPNGVDPSVSTGTITPVASFSLSVQFSPAYVAQGQQLIEDIVATLIQGSVGPVTYSISGLPPKATASFSPPSCTPTCVTLLTVNIDPATPLGTYNTTITAQSQSGTSASVGLTIVVVASSAVVAQVNCNPAPPPSLSEVQLQKLRIPGTRPLQLPPEKFTKLPPAADPAIPCYVSTPIETSLDLYVYGSGPLQGVTVRFVIENAPFIVKQTDSNGHVFFEYALFISPRTGLPVNYFHLDILPQDGVHACAWVNANINGPAKLEVTLTTNPPPNIVLPLTYTIDTPNTLFVFNPGQVLCPPTIITAGRLDFTSSTDPTYIFVADLKQIPGVRFTAGGLLLKSSGVYQAVQPFQAPPAFPGSAALFDSGFAVPYYTGLIIYIGNTTSQYICQADSRGFILFRGILGTTSVPLLDGMNYSTNGSVSAGVASLSPNQYIVFYPPTMSAPPLGSYISADIEYPNGAQVQLQLTTGATVTFYVQAGKNSSVIYIYNPGFNSINNWISAEVVSYVKYQTTGHVNLPGYPIFIFTWEWRQYDANGSALGAAIVADGSGYPVPVYMNDPNVTTWQGANFVPVVIKAISQSALPSGWDFGFAYQFGHYDSTETLRYYRRAAIVFQDAYSMWKLRVYSYINMQTNTYNYDEGGDTTGYSHASYLRRGLSTVLNSGYLVYNGVWNSGTWNSSGYTWLDGYWASRTTLPPTSPAVSTCYIYSKYIIAGSNESPTPSDGTYRISHYSGYSYIFQYFNVWADVTLPTGWSGGEETEFWYAESDTYEASPPKPSFTGNTTWIDGFF